MTTFELIEELMRIDPKGDKEVVVEVRRSIAGMTTKITGVSHGLGLASNRIVARLEDDVVFMAMFDQLRIRNGKE